MSERRRELGRATVEVEGRVYGLLVYVSTWDEWDDPEGRFTERAAIFGPDRPMPDPGWLEADETGMHMTASADIIGRTVDGGGSRRRRDEQLRERSQQRERELAALRAKVTDEAPRIVQLRHDCGYVGGSAGEFAEPAYECARCGRTLLGEDGRRCADDNIFTAKIADHSCPSCEEPIDNMGDLDPVVGVEVDGHFIPESELKGDDDG